MPTPAISLSEARFSEVVNPAHDHHYVTAIDGNRLYLLAGPYETNEDAMASVRPVRDIAIEGNPRAHFFGFGTSSSCEVHDTPLGVL